MREKDASMPATAASAGSNNLLLRVRGGFISKGTTLAEWCRTNSVDHAYAHRVLRGYTNGPSALALRERIVGAAA